ncbi:MAG: Hsp20/alpha crystallin family protein [Desulfarculus sp.]|nr:Hsp20/alpha crystallin family protein [Desulfarculus sp.]
MYELIPFGGLRPVGLFGRDLDRLWEGLLGDLVPGEEREAGFRPSVDVKDSPDGYEVVADLPGFKAEEVQVELCGDVLIISGEKKDERQEEKGEWRLVERRRGSFRRGFRLPEPIERGKLSAVHRDGVLRVHLPKLGREEPVKVEVKAA